MSDKPYGSIFWNLLIIDGLRETKHDGAKQVAEKVSAALVKTIYNEYDRHHTLFENVIIFYLKIMELHNKRLFSHLRFLKCKKLPMGRLKWFCINSLYCIMQYLCTYNLLSC